MNKDELITGTPTAEDIKDVAHEALNDFWSHVAKRFPKLTTGDLSPETTVRLEEAAISAVTEWWNNNCKDQI